MSTTRKKKHEIALLNYLSKPKNLYVEEDLPKHWLASIVSSQNKNKYGDIKMYYNIKLDRFYTYNPYTKELHCIEPTKGGSRSTRKKRKNGVKTSHVKV